jgi:16S rRNA (uracil1498-N3)-methyltransferase
VDRVPLDAPADPDGRITIEGPARRHLGDSLRVRPGEVFLAIDGRGTERRLAVESSDRRRIVARVVEERTRPPGPGRGVTLAIAPPKGTRMETAVEKTTELGVGRIVPLRLARSVVKGRSGSERAERWARVAAAAAAQSGRFRVPDLDDVHTLDEVIARAGADRARALLLHLDPDAGPLEAALEGLHAGDPVVLLVGPEGGFSEEEAARARAGGALVVSLGANRLRTETAAIVAVARTIAAVSTPSPGASPA